MTWVKVCGITTPDARDAAIEAGADALGFNLIAGSPRRLDIIAAGKLIAGSTVRTYILVADCHPDTALTIAEACGADGIQAYGRHADAVARHMLAEGYQVLWPIGVGELGPTQDPRVVPDEAVVLFDTAVPGAHGGSGRTFDRRSITTIDRPFVIAGGLGPDNVHETIVELDPFGVDASSRLESSPGVKDPDTIRAFVEEAKRS